MGLVESLEGNLREFAKQSHAGSISSESVNVAAENLMHLLLAIQSPGIRQRERKKAFQATTQQRHREIAPVHMVSPPAAELVQLLPMTPPLQNGKLAVRVSEEAEEVDGYDPSAVDPDMYRGGEMLSSGKLTIAFKVELTRERILIGTDIGTLMIFSSEEPPITLLEGFTPGSLMDACLNERENVLHIVGSGTLWRCELDEDACTSVDVVPNLDSSLTPGTTIFSVACDKTGNLYLGTTEGIVILNEAHEAYMRVNTREAVAHIRFDRFKRNRLYFRVGGVMWQFDTNAMGDMPNIDLAVYLSSDSVQRHEGW